MVLLTDDFQVFLNVSPNSLISKVSNVEHINLQLIYFFLFSLGLQWKRQRALGDEA